MFGSSYLVLIQPPPNPVLSLRHRLFGSIDNNWLGRNVFNMFAAHPYEIYQIAGETPESLLDIVNSISPMFQQSYRDVLSPRNRVMLFLTWLRSYPCFSMLSAMLGVCLGTVSNEIEKLRLVFWNFYAGSVVWPSENEWREKMGYWPEFNDVVAIADGTSHWIYRPLEDQNLYYSGHRHGHVINTMVVVDNRGVLRFVRSGYLGHQNDAQLVMLMPNIGPNCELPFPAECVIIGDKIFPNRYPFMTAYKRDQIMRKPPNMRRKFRKFNRKLNKRRVKVEHAIRDIKTYRVIGTLWRMPRWKISSVVDICTALVIRKKRLEINL